MEDALIMGVLDGASHPRHQRDAPARLIAQDRGRIDQAAARREFHAKKWEAVFAFAHFVDGQYVWMIEARRRFGFAPKAGQSLARIGVVTQNTFHCHDAARVSLTRAVNYSHPA